MTLINRKVQSLKQVIMAGLVFGVPENVFDSNKPYVACRLCGGVFQGPLDLRVPPGHEPENSLIAKLAKNRRDDWAATHATKEHTEDEHRLLRLSGRFATPIASQRLAALGIISIVDAVIDDEIPHALAEAHRQQFEEKEVEH